MKNRNVMDRWTATARGTVPGKAATQGKPKGELKLLFQMEAEWARIPNTCFEDEAGQLWLADAKLRSQPIQIDTERGYEAVTGEEFLDWLYHVLEFVDGYDGDPMDICRIALREIRSRPAYVGMVKKALVSEVEAGFKPRGTFLRELVRK